MCRTTPPGLNCAAQRSATPRGQVNKMGLCNVHYTVPQRKYNHLILGNHKVRVEGELN